MTEYDQILQDASNTDGVYEQLLMDELNAGRPAALITAKEATAVPPDRSAQVIDLSTKLKLPPSFVERNFDAFKREDSVRTAGDFYDRVLTNPKAREWFNDKYNVAAAQDDLSNLDLMSWIIQAPARAYATGEAQVEAGRILHRQMLGQATAEELKKLEPLKARMRVDLGAESLPAQMLTGGAQQLPNLLGALAQGFQTGLPTAMVAGTLATAAGPASPVTVPAVTGAGYLAGSIAGAARFTFEQESGFAYEEYLQFRDEDGKPLDPGVAKMAALAAGAVNSGLEVAQIGILLRSIPGLDKLAQIPGRFLVRKALQQQSFRMALATLAKQYGGTLAAESAIEVAQRATTILAGELTKVVSSQDFELRDPSDIGRDLLQEGAQAAIGFSLLVAPGPLIRAGIDVRQAHNATQRENFFKALGSTMEASKLRERSPAATADLISRITADGPVENVYVEPQVMERYFQDHGIDPRQAMREVMGSPEEFDKALASGHMLAIPIEQYATTLAPTEHNAFFAKELRFSPEEMNLREVEEAVKAAKDEQAQQEQAAQEEEIKQTVADQVKGMLEAAGQDPKAAEQMAAQMDAFFSAQAERVQSTPMDLFKKYALDVVRKISGKNAERTPEMEIGQVDEVAAARDRKELQNFAEGLRTDAMGQAKFLMELTKSPAFKFQPGDRLKSAGGNIFEVLFRNPIQVKRKKGEDASANREYEPGYRVRQLTGEFAGAEMDASQAAFVAKMSGPAGTWEQNQKVIKLRATGAAAQWIIRNDRAKDLDWPRFLKMPTEENEGLHALGKMVDATWYVKWMDPGHWEKRYAEVNLKDYLTNLVQNIGVAQFANQQLQDAVNTYQRNPNLATHRLQVWVGQERERIIGRWIEYMVNENPVYWENPFFRDYVMEGLVEKLRNNQPDLPVELDAAALADVYIEVENNPQGQKFMTLYSRALEKIAEADKSRMKTVDSNGGKQWIKIPQTPESSPDFNKNAQLLRTLSCSTWCTSRGMERTYVRTGDFWILRNNGVTELAIRFIGTTGRVAEIQGPLNNGTIPTHLAPDVKKLVDSGELELSSQSKAALTKQLRQLESERKFAEMTEGQLITYFGETIQVLENGEIWWNPPAGFVGRERTVDRLLRSKIGQRVSRVYVPYSARRKNLELPAGNRVRQIYISEGINDKQRRALNNEEWGYNRGAVIGDVRHLIDTDLVVSITDDSPAPLLERAGGLDLLTKGAVVPSWREFRTDLYKKGGVLWVNNGAAVPKNITHLASLEVTIPPGEVVEFPELEYCRHLQTRLHVNRNESTPGNIRAPVLKEVLSIGVDNWDEKDFPSLVKMRKFSGRRHGGEFYLDVSKYAALKEIILWGGWAVKTKVEATKPVNRIISRLTLRSEHMSDGPVTVDIGQVKAIDWADLNVGHSREYRLPSDVNRLELRASEGGVTDVYGAERVRRIVLDRDATSANDRVSPIVNFRDITVLDGYTINQYGLRNGGILTYWQSLERISPVSFDDLLFPTRYVRDGFLDLANMIAPKLETIETRRINFHSNNQFPALKSVTASDRIFFKDRAQFYGMRDKVNVTALHIFYEGNAELQEQPEEIGGDRQGLPDHYDQYDQSPAPVVFNNPLDVTAPLPNQWDSSFDPDNNPLHRMLADSDIVREALEDFTDQEDLIGDDLYQALQSAEDVGRIGSADGFLRSFGIEGIKAGDLMRPFRDQDAELILEQAGWHGSGARFEKFSLDHIGTGQGATAHGWGLYIAKQKETGARYRDEHSVRTVGRLSGVETSEVFGPYEVRTLFGLQNESDRRAVIEDKLDRIRGRIAATQIEIRVLNNRLEDNNFLGIATGSLRNKLVTAEYHLQDERHKEAIVQYLLDGEDTKVGYSGRLYEVDVAAHDNELLDLDQPVGVSNLVPVALHKEYTDKLNEWGFDPTFEGDAEELLSKVLNDPDYIKQETKKDIDQAEVSGWLSDFILRWDRTRKEPTNPEMLAKVEKALSVLGPNQDTQFVLEDNVTGREVYETLARYAYEALSVRYRRDTGEFIENETRNSLQFFDPVTFSDAALINMSAEEIASKVLLKAGIKGLKYVGRQDGPAMVVFDDSIIDIMSYEQAANPFSESVVQQRVFHGTGSSFAAFSHRSRGKNFGSKSSLGFSFTSNPDTASEYAEMHEPDGLITRGFPNVRPAYINLKNPLILNTSRLLEDHFNIDTIEHGRSIVADLKKKGHDGIMSTDPLSGEVTYVVFDPGQVVSAITLNQDPAAPRGRMLKFGEYEYSIELLENADLSTFLHESGHFYLEVLKSLARDHQVIADDLQVLLDWMGVKSTDDIKREHHEMFARGLEAYFMEGKSPSIALRPVFARFRTWLIALYQNIRNLNIKLNDDVRGFMDRLFATKAEIEAAEREAQVQPLFLTPEHHKVNMTPEQWANYQAKVQEARTTAQENLEARIMRDYKREHQLWWNEQKRLIREEVGAEFNDDRDTSAAAVLISGKLPDGSPLPEGFDALKLDRASVVAAYGKADSKANNITEQLRKLGVYRGEGGVSIDHAAELLGFTSGDELVRAVLDKANWRDRIEQETDLRMKQRWGDALTDGTLHEMALAAVNNDKRAELLHAELRALVKLRNQVQPFVQEERNRQRAERTHGLAMVRGVPPLEMFQRLAAARIATMQLRAIRPHTYFVAARQASAEAVDAATKGDYQTAAVAKQREIFNMELYRVASNAREEVDRGLDYVREFARPPARKRLGLAGEVYLNQVLSLLERFDFAPISNKDAERRVRMAEFIERMEQDNQPVDIDPKLVDEAFRKPYKLMTFEEFSGVVDAFRNIDHLAKLKNKLLKAKHKRELADVLNAVEAKIRSNPPRRRRDVMEERLPQFELSRFAESFFAAHRKLASLAREMDGLEDGGVVWEHVVLPLNEASNHEASMIHEAGRRLDELFKPYATGKRIVENAMTRLTGGRVEAGVYKREYIKQIGTSLSWMQRLMVAMNTGTEDNLQKMKDGYGWTQEQVDAIIEPLTAEDWKFVQGVLDFVNEFWPLVKAKQERVTGVAPEKVPARKIQTKFGELNGGYFPALYDDRISPVAYAHRVEEAAKLTMQGGYARRTTKRGHTMERVEGVKMPMRLDFGAVFEHVHNVIHDLAFHEALLDVSKVVSHRQTQQAIIDVYGDITYKMINAAINDTAAGEIMAVTAFEKSANWLRHGVSIAAMGWNLTTGLLQPFGLTQSMVRIGPAWVFKGISRWIGDSARMENSVKWIHSKSELMRNRYFTLNREINDVRNRLSGGAGTSVISDSYFWLITRFQLVADVPTWLGAYEKAMADPANDGNEERAIALADQAVLDSQGGGQVKDLADIQRHGPMMRLWTNFISYFNVTHNLTAEQVHRTNVRDPASVAALAWNLLLLYSVPAVLSLLMKEALNIVAGGEPPETEDLIAKLAHEQAGYVLGTMVGVRELSSAVQGFYGYEGPAGTRFYSEASNLIKQTMQGEADDALWKALNSTGGILLHYPSGQTQRTVEGYVAIQEGRAGPSALITGKPKEQR